MIICINADAIYCYCYICYEANDLGYFIIGPGVYSSGAVSIKILLQF